MQEHRVHSEPTAPADHKGAEVAALLQAASYREWFAGVGIIPELGTAWNASREKRALLSHPLLLCSSYFLPNTNTTWHLPASRKVFGCSGQSHPARHRKPNSQRSQQSCPDAELRDYPADQSAEPEVAPMLLNWSGAQLNIF